jgi:hypothetical protein
MIRFKVCDGSRFLRCDLKQKVSKFKINTKGNTIIGNQNVPIIQWPPDLNLK